MGFFETYGVYLIFAIALFIVLISYIIRSISMKNITTPTDIALEKKRKYWGTYVVELDKEDSDEETEDVDNTEPNIEIRYYSKRIYEKVGKEKETKNVLGPKQAVIYGKKYLFFVGLLIISILSFGLYSLFVEKKSYFTPTTINVIIFSIIAAAGIILGLQLIYYSTRAIVFRRDGFEKVSMFGKKTYEYKEADFNLTNKLVNSNSPDHYYLSANKNRYRRLWVLHISFIDGRKPIILKSSQYWNIRLKASDLINSLTWIY